MPDWPVALRCDVVELRPIRLADARQWSRLRVRDRVAVRDGEFHTPVPFRLANSTVVLAVAVLRLRRRARRGQALPWVVASAETRFAGRLALYRVTATDAEIGGWIAGPHTGHGLYTAAVALAVEHGVTRLGLRRIYAHVRTGNTAGRRPLEKLGFRAEGRFTRREGDGVRREWCRLALLASDWDRRQG